MSARLRSRSSAAAFRAAPAAGRRAALGTLAAVALLPGCSSLNWLKTRFVEPKEESVAAGPSAAKPVSSAPAPAAVAPAASAGAAAPPVAAPVTARPAAPPAEAARAVTSAPSPAAPVAAPAVARAAPAQPPKAAGDLAPGRYAVQVAVFMTAAFAETRRSRLVEQLLANAMPEADATRVVARDDRHFVLVGDLADRGQAEALAARLRSALRQDVVIFRR